MANAVRNLMLRRHLRTVVLVVGSLVPLVYASTAATASASGSPSSYERAVLADHPTAYYQFNDPTGARVYADSSGNGNTAGSDGPTTLLTPGPLGPQSHALSLEGGIEAIFTPELTPMQGDNERTVELWFETTQTGDQCVLNAGDQSHTNAFSLCLTDGKQGSAPLPNTPGVYLQTYDADVYIPNLTLTDGNWHYIAATLSGSAVSIVVDGQTPSGFVWNASFYSDLTTQPFTLPLQPNTSRGSVGVGDPGWAAGFTGGIGEVAIYPTALTPTQLAAHYAAATKTPPPGGGGGGGGTGGGPALVGTKTDETSSSGHIWYLSCDSEAGFCEPYVWSYRLTLTVEADWLLWTPPPGKPTNYWVFPSIVAGMVIPGGANSYGIDLVPSVGAYIEENALRLSCVNPASRYNVPLTTLNSIAGQNDTHVEERGTLAAGFNAPLVTATGTAAAADWDVQAGAITGVATPASLQYPGSCPGGASASRFKARKSVSVPAPSHVPAPNTGSGNPLPHYRGHGAVCGNALALRFCTPRPPHVTVGGSRVPSVAVSLAMIDVSRRDGLPLGGSSDMAAAAAQTVADTVLRRVAIARGLESTLGQAHKDAVNVLLAARADPSGARSVGLVLTGKGLTQFLLAPRKLDGLRILEAKDRLWHKIVGSATGSAADSRLISWLIPEARRLKVHVAGVEGFSLARDLTLALSGSLSTH
jgi:Concanavalin A-like lectin/glucanases superfamily